MVTSNLGTAVKSAAAALPAVPSPVTDTFTTVSVVNTVDPLNVAFTVTVAAEPPSAAPVWSPGVSESTSTLRSMAVGAASLSSMVTVAPLTVNPDAAPPTVSVSDDSTTLSSTAVSRKPVLSATLDCADGMVNTREGSMALAAANLKSPDAAVTPAADRVISVSASYVLEPSGNEADTVIGYADDRSVTAVCTPSAAEVSTPRLMTVGPASLSESMVIVSASTVRPERSVAPDTVMVSDTTSTTLSSVTVRVKVPDASRPPAGMVRSNVLLVLSVEKSDDSALPAAPSPDTVTETVVADSKVFEPAGNSALTATVAAASPSPIVS